MRQLAWLSCIPKGSGESRMSQIDRLALIGGEEPEYNLPWESATHYLVEMLSEIGEARSESGFLKSQSWAEINAWRDLNGIDLSGDEVKAIMDLSIAYSSQYNESVDVDCMQPNAPVDEVAVDRVSSKLSTFFKMLRASKASQ